MTQSEILFLLQVPLQEWAVNSLEAKEEAAGLVHGVSKEHAEIFRDAQQNVSAEVSLPGKGSAFDPEC